MKAKRGGKEKPLGKTGRERCWVVERSRGSEWQFQVVGRKKKKRKANKQTRKLLWVSKTTLRFDSLQRTHTKSAKDAYLTRIWKQTGTSLQPSGIFFFVCIISNSTVVRIHAGLSNVDFSPTSSLMEKKVKYLIVVVIVFVVMAVFVVGGGVVFVLLLLLSYFLFFFILQIQASISGLQVNLV